MIDLNFISKIAPEYSKAREKNGSVEKGSTLNLLKHCAMEVIEAAEAYSILNSAINDNREYERNIIEEQENFESELADVIACILIICANEPTIDIEEALQKCFQKNLARAEGRGDKK